MYRRFRFVLIGRNGNTDPNAAPQPGIPDCPLRGRAPAARSPAPPAGPPLSPRRHPPRRLRTLPRRTRERSNHSLLESPAQALRGVPRGRRQSAGRRGRHRAHQRQVEPAAAARAGVRLPARVRRPRDWRSHLCHPAVLRTGGGASRRPRPVARPPCGGTARRGGRQPARPRAGVPQPQRRAPVGDRLERTAPAHPAGQPGAVAPVVYRVRPRSDVRRRGLLGPRAPVARRACLAVRAARGRAARDLLAGAVDPRSRAARRPRARRATRGRGAGAADSRPGLHEPSPQCGAARAAADRGALAGRLSRPAPARGVPADLSLRRRGPHPRRAIPAPSARRLRRRTGGARGVRRALRHGTVAASRGAHQGFAPRRSLAAIPAARRCAVGRARPRDRAPAPGASRARQLPLGPRVHARAERCGADQPRLPRSAAPPRLHPPEQGPAPGGLPQPRHRGAGRRLRGPARAHPAG